MPAPSDVQAANGGATVGRAETGDSITFTFASAVPPSDVMSGWDGSATNVTLTLHHSGSTTYLAVLDPGGSILWSLGWVDLNGNYVTGADDDFTGSTMTASGSTVTVVLGTPSTSGARTVSVPTTMVWVAGFSSVSESGIPDVEF